MALSPRITVTEEDAEIFDRLYIERNAQAVRHKFKVGEILRYKPPSATIEAYTRHPPGLLMTIGAMTHVVDGGGDLLHLRAGRYCSIARDVSVANGNHPLEAVTTNPFHFHDYYLKNMPEELRYTGPTKEFTRSYGMVTVGHDVWIGQRVLFLGGVRVGNGAMIAAGSVVTKDVEPYTVVGGAPAKFIKHRFPAKTIEMLQETEWWNYHPRDWKHLPMFEPEQFSREFLKLKNKGSLEIWKPAKIHVKNNTVSEIA